MDNNIEDIDNSYILITERIQEDYIIVEKKYDWYKCKGGICTKCESISARIRYLIPKKLTNKNSPQSLCDYCYDIFIHTHYPLSELNIEL